MILRVESYSNKQSSFKSLVFFGVHKQMLETACSFVVSPMMGYKDKKHSLVGQVLTGKFGSKRFLKMEQKPWLAYFMKGMLFGCEQPFLWGERCVTSQTMAVAETIPLLTYQQYLQHAVMLFHLPAKLLTIKKKKKKPLLNWLAHYFDNSCTDLSTHLCHRAFI